MKNVEEAEKLSKMMVELGHKFGRRTVAVITNMDEPLGLAIGNSLEVIEAIDTLKGQGPKDLTELCLVLGAKLLVLGNKCENEEVARELLQEKITSGEALNKFKEFVRLQGGDASYIDDVNKFKLSSIKKEVYSEKEGYVKSINALGIGEASKDLGAGRETKDSILDLGSGIMLNKKIDDFVKKGDLLATIYTEKSEEIEDVTKMIIDSYDIGEKNKEAYKLIIKEIY